MQLNFLKSFYNKEANFLKIAYCTGAFILAVFVVLRVAIIFSFVPEITGIDNNFVYAVARRLAGLPIYPNPTQFPYAVNLYAPLYYDICYLAGKLLNVAASNTIAIYRLCRFVSFINDAGTCYLLYIILFKNLQQPKTLSVFAVAVFTSFLCYLAYTFSRSDSLLLFFYTLLFYLLTKKEKLHSTKTILLLALICTACIFSKQNGIVTPAFVTIWLFWLQYKKQLYLFLFSLFILLLSCSLLYTQVLNYNYLFAHIITGIQNKIDSSWFYVYIFKQLANSLLLIPLSTGLTLAILFLLKSNFTYKKALALIYLVQLLFSLLSSLKYGSSLGYFNESLVLAFILIACQLNTFNPAILQAYAHKLLPFLLPVVVVYFIHVTAQDYLFFVSQQAQQKEGYNRQQNIKNYLLPKLGNTYVFNLNDPNRDFFKTLFYKQIAVPNFDAVNCCTLPDGNFDYTNLKADLVNGNIKFIIMPANKTYTHIWSVPLHHYQHDTTISQYSIYKYNAAIK